MHPIIDKAVSENWPVVELVEVLEAFEKGLLVVEAQMVKSVENIKPQAVEQPNEDDNADRRRMHWTESEESRLEHYLACELSAREIAKRMGRTSKAIEHKISKIKER